MNVKSNNEYDALGELFRRRLENHRIPVDGNGWDEIERRLGKRKKKSAVWLWSVGAAAAASIALMFIVRQPVSDETSVMTVSQQVILDESETTHHDATPNTESGKILTEQNTVSVRQNPVRDSRTVEKNMTIAQNMPSKIGETGEIEEFGEIGKMGETGETGNIVKKDSVIQKFDDSKIQKLVDDDPEKEEESVKKSEKWLFAAAFSTGGSTTGFLDKYENSSSSPLASKDYHVFYGNNNYATELSHNIRSFNDISRDKFTNIQHRVPLSFGLTARKSLGKNGGVESGLIYTYLSSRFEWEGYHVNQSLHYLGVPVNMVVYFGNAKSNWRVYLSGGFMVEKGLRAIYRQERLTGSEIRNTTVKSRIGSLQWSLNGALGVNYRLEKGWGIYFEPRVGYSFDCNQPISVRTEMPLFFGINMGLNYEL